MKQKTFLIDFPTKDLYKLPNGYNFVDYNGVFCSYYTENLNKKNAIKSAKRLLKMRLRTNE